jgi:hypothetical protein
MTKNIVPRANEDGNIGTALKNWLKGWFVDIFVSGNLTDGSNNISVANTADAITKKHVAHSDDQDLSNLVPKTTQVNGHPLSADVTVTKSDVTLGNVDDKSEATIITDVKADTEIALVITNTHTPHSDDETTTSEGSLINGATAKSTPIDADMIGVMDSAVSNILKKLSWANIKAVLKTYFDSLYQEYIPLGNLTAPVATSGTTETLLFKLAIPANFVAVGDSFRIFMYGVSSSTGTLIFRAKVGANGSTTDNQAWISTTSAAQVANAWAGFDVLVTVRSATTVQASGHATAGAIVLPQLIGAAAPAAIVSTAIWYIDITCTCSAGTFTAQVATIGLVKI